MPEPLFAAVEARRAAAPAVPPRAGRPALRPGVGAASSRRRRASRCCAAATRASTSGCATTSSTASCRSATTCWPAARWRRMVVLEAVGRLVPGRDGQRGVGRRRVVRRRPARVPAVHPTGRVPGLGGAGGAAVAATTPGSPAGAGPRRCARTARAPARPASPARGGLSTSRRARRLLGASSRRSAHLIRVSVVPGSSRLPRGAAP